MLTSWSPAGFVPSYGAPEGLTGWTFISTRWGPCNVPRPHSYVVASARLFATCRACRGFILLSCGSHVMREWRPCIQTDDRCFPISTDRHLSAKPENRLVRSGARDWCLCGLSLRWFFALDFCLGGVAHSLSQSALRWGRSFLRGGAQREQGEAEGGGGNATSHIDPVRPGLR